MTVTFCGHRDKWLTDNGDVLIAHVVLDRGGAAAARRYAMGREKRVINYKEEDTNGGRV